MTHLRIQIPITAEGEELTRQERAAREQAAMDELEARIAGLKQVKHSIPTLGSRAIGGRMYLCLTLQRHPQLQLNLGDWSGIPGRLLEMDPTIMDQHAIAESLQATRMLLARAVRREPQALKAIAEEMGKQSRNASVRQLRKVLGQRYILNFFGEDEEIQLPLVQTLAVNEAVLRFRLQVTNMRENIGFRARRIEVLSASENAPQFSPSKTMVFACARLGSARTYRSGQLLHESMERKRSVQVDGQLVIEMGTGQVVALEVTAVVRDDAT